VDVRDIPVNGLEQYRADWNRSLGQGALSAKKSGRTFRDKYGLTDRQAIDILNGKDPREVVPFGKFKDSVDGRGNFNESAHILRGAKVETKRDIADARNAMARGNYPLGMTDCEVCGINGQCGMHCPVFKDGECAVEDEEAFVGSAHRDFDKMDKEEVIAYLKDVEIEELYPSKTELLVGIYKYLRDVIFSS
jgi:hypothetical protein